MIRILEGQPFDDDYPDNETHCIRLIGEIVNVKTQMLIEELVAGRSGYLAANEAATWLQVCGIEVQPISLIETAREVVAG